MRSPDAFEKAFRAKYRPTGRRSALSLFYPRAVNEMRMLEAAIEKAKSIEPAKIGAALEGMKVEVFDGGEGYMRADDHQFMQPHLYRLVRRSQREGALRRGRHRLGLEDRRTRIETVNTMLPTTCKMSRPAS